MKTIIGISGSLRKGSFNSALLREAARSAPPGVEVVIQSIAAIPLYNGDEEEQSGIPKPVQELKDAIAEAQGLLLATPEYNNSIPGVLKNAIDWLTRPPSDIKRVFSGKPAPLWGPLRAASERSFPRTPGFRSCGRLVRSRGSAADCSSLTLIKSSATAVRSPKSGSKSKSGSSFRASLPHFDAGERYEPVHVGSSRWRVTPRRSAGTTAAARISLRVARSRHPMLS
jgi:NADPH-dependent FMN reductase